ncbi:MAG TPA: hypothetical protein VNS08_17925 [Ureibacillus sp.]|nr:hypothetical protein [Ureibacillus sp.]
MKKSKVVLVFLFLVLFITIWMVIHGVSSKEEEFISEVNEYLDQKYPIKMKLINEPKYSLKSGTYSVSVSPEGMEYITFAAYQSSNNKEEYSDRFSYEYWTYEANNELKKIIKEANFQYEVTGKFIMIGGSSQSILYEGSMPKPYQEVKSYLGSGTSLHINIDNSFNDNDMETLYYFISLIKQQEFQFEWMSITFNGDKKNFRFNFDEINSLVISSDLKILMMNY